jgi:dTDP-4-amino-4,6-dideoxygalactose transaminase
MNGRLDTLQAAILLEKLSIFAEEITARSEIAARYTDRIKDLVDVPRIPDGLASVWAQYTIRLPASVNRGRVMARLEAAGVPSAVYYAKPLHRQPFYSRYPVAGNGLPVAERLAAEVLSLPMHPYLDAATQDRIAAALEAALRG